MQEAEPLQQVRRTYVRYRGQILSYFSGCDYYRLSSHPKILAAVSSGLKRYGLNVSASRITTGNHRVYLELEQELARFFGAESALVTSTGYVTNLIAAQASAGGFSHALIDERSHPTLQDAAALLNCPVLRFKHRDVTDFCKSLGRCGSHSRPVVLTDGMFSHNGSVAPLAQYLKPLPKDGLIIVDDAHGVGTVGETGRGSLEAEGVARQRIVQNITLSKAFGTYGGAILCSRRWREKLMQSRVFVGSTPPPLPLAYAAREAVRILATHPDLQAKLRANSDYVKSKLRKEGLALENFPGPILPVHLKSNQANTALRQALLRAKILPPFICYPGAPAGGYFRFVISSEHTKSQLDNLVRTLSPFVQRCPD